MVYGQGIAYIFNIYKYISLYLMTSLSLKHGVLYATECDKRKPTGENIGSVEYTFMSRRISRKLTNIRTQNY